MEKNIAIRCISEKSKGFGNFSRSLTLCKNLKKKGFEVDFIINSNDYLESRLKKEKFNYIIIPKKVNFKNEDSFLIKKYFENKYKIIILDMREYGEQLSKKLLKYIPIVLIDDAFSKNVYSNIIINGSINKKFHNYIIKNNKNKKYLGPNFFMANNNFLKNKKKQIEIKKKNKYKIIISIGGSDPNQLTIYILKSIVMISNIKITIIVGPFFTDSNKIIDICKNYKNVEVKYSPIKIWNEFKKADVVISKSGITLYELAIMGIPTMCISSFKHEEPSAKEFMKKKFLINLGMQKNVNKNQIKFELLKLLKDTKKRKLMSAQGKKIVDGKGLERVTKIIDSFLVKIK
jgi:UDP-2,4-diacetamido-2,4,6-trideoxy-beta-L-altropyranose hydrolase